MAALVESILLLCFALSIAVSHAKSSSSSLSPSFYAKTCPKLEGIVAARVQYFTGIDPNVPAGLLRLHFHDCFVNGCDASVLLDSTSGNKAEMDAKPNLSLEGFDVVDDIKAAVEAACPKTVSCADILALAAREGVFLAGGPSWDVDLGRRDSLTSKAKDAEKTLPSEKSNVTQLLDVFGKFGFDKTDVITLSGAHTLGHAQCKTVTDRMANSFPPISAKLKQKLNTICQGSSVQRPVVVPLDNVSPNKFDNLYYKNLMYREGVLTSDQWLYFDPKSKRLVKKYASNQNVFFLQFKASMVKMGRLSPLLGSAGQIRTNCHFKN
eukprot:TRINITY_DN695_c0_g2_i1.p1 TRINITY_DN695_c0_g2~~TRINITY_DN695_c0_g2_i1.p1  ORF type:complete len:323 (-),score=28.19 TRINITY_DN695_c0_g2_i1:178-1146(-)